MGYAALLYKLEPFKMEKANWKFFKAQMFFLLGLFCFFILILVQDGSISFYKSLDWIATYIFYMSILLSLDVFYKHNPGKWVKPPPTPRK
jgi:Ca2+/Na+ antiporter